MSNSINRCKLCVFLGPATHLQFALIAQYFCREDKGEFCNYGRVSNGGVLVGMMQVRLKPRVKQRRMSLSSQMMKRSWRGGGSRWHSSRPSARHRRRLAAEAQLWAAVTTAAITAALTTGQVSRQISTCCLPLCWDVKLCKEADQSGLRLYASALACPIYGNNIVNHSGIPLSSCILQSLFQGTGTKQSMYSRIT